MTDRYNPNGYPNDPNGHPEGVSPYNQPQPEGYDTANNYAGYEVPAGYDTAQTPMLTARPTAQRRWGSRNLMALQWQP